LCWKKENDYFFIFSFFIFFFLRNNVCGF
jgi:hypothetical protein